VSTFLVLNRWPDGSSSASRVGGGRAKSGGQRTWQWPAWKAGKGPVEPKRVAFVLKMPAGSGRVKVGPQGRGIEGALGEEGRGKGR